MKKPYLLSIEYIRGIAMLGVIGIHTSVYHILVNPSPNIALISMLDVLTRFSVPIFFFISAFGIFYKMDLGAHFDYKSFLQRRLKAVLIPYLIWSIIYIIHNNIFGYSDIPNLSYFLEILFFGLAKYHLYFLVILIWFYFLMPLWIKIIKVLTPRKLVVIFFAQIIFNHLSFTSDVFSNFANSLPDDSILKLFLIHRESYLVLHYIFLYLLGGFLGINSQKFFNRISQSKKFISIIFLMTAAAHVGYFCFLIYFQESAILRAAEITNQLSTTGFLYSVAASIFFFMLFESCNFPKIIQSILSTLGKNSYFIYLSHPLFMDYLIVPFNIYGIIPTVGVTIFGYLFIIFISLIASILWKKLLKKFSYL